MPTAVQHRFWSRAPLASVQQDLEAHTAPLEGGFTLLHRLSGAGVVVRTLRAPETDCTLFGSVRESDFSVAFVPNKTDITPFHPIIRGQLTDRPDGGTLVTVELAHHPDARTWAPLYLFGSLVLGVGTVLRLDDQPPLLYGGLALAVLFAVFPTLQARIRFTEACRQTSARFAELLKLEPAP